MNLFKSLLNFIFPISCLNCGQEDTFLCFNCLNKIELRMEQCCHFCKKTSLYGQTCSKHYDEFFLKGVMVATSYNPLIEKIIKQLKYRYSTDLVEPISQLLAKVLPLNKFSDSTLVPVPLHQRRYNDRGFNQSLLLAEALGKRVNLPVKNILQKTVNTKPQANLNREERLFNVRDCFSLKEQISIENQKIILIDDVISTGTTINECAKVLQKEGIKEIWGLVLARG